MIGTAEKVIMYMTEQLKIDPTKRFTVDDYHEKRSLTQNAYMWHLINEIANKVNLSKEKVYFQMLKDYSQSILTTIRADIQVSNYFKYYEEERETIINGVKFKIYKVYEGSSQMNKKEFTILLNGVIQEAQQLGIDTMTYEEVSKLRWIENEK